MSTVCTVNATFLPSPDNCGSPIRARVIIASKLNGGLPAENARKPIAPIRTNRVANCMPFYSSGGCYDGSTGQVTLKPIFSACCRYRADLPSHDSFIPGNLTP